MSWKGIAANVLERAGVREQDGLAARVPYRLPGGAEHAAKIFGSGRRWWERPGVDLILFGLETLPRNPEFAAHCGILLCEGESDALASREAFAVSEQPDVVAWYAIALPGSGTWRRSWRSHLLPFPLVYLLGDGDRAGRAMNARIKRDVPWARPVWLPEGEDVRSILQGYGPRALDGLLDAADADARLAAAFVLAHDLTTFEALLRGEEVQR